MKRHDAIRQLFLGGDRAYHIHEAAHLLGWSVEHLRAELSAQYVAPEDLWCTAPVPWRAVAVLAMGEWSHAQIEQALATEASVLPSLLRTAPLEVWLPAYQIAVIRSAAQRARTTVDDFLARYLLDLSCTEAPALSADLPGFHEAFHWPASASKHASEAQPLAPAAS